MSPESARGRDLVVLTASAEETEELGRRLGAVLARGDVIGLIGDLGTGKTAFVRGLAEGLGAGQDVVASPTFTMIAEYRGGRLTLFHVDLYRLDPGDVDLVSLREYVYGPGVTAIEWYDRLPPGALDACLLVRIDYAQPGRRVAFEACGDRAAVLIAALRGSPGSAYP